MTTSDDVICSSADVTIGCWASARAAPGCERECFTGHHVGILEAAAAAYTGL